MPSRVSPPSAATFFALCLAAVAAVAAWCGVAASPAAAASAAAPARAILAVAGTGATCTGAGCGDGGLAAAAAVSYPEAVATDGQGDLYVVDWGQSTIRRVTPDGHITTVAGDGVACDTAPDCGDGGPATDAELGFPSGIAVDRHGDVFVADTADEEIREVLPDGRIERVAGTGTSCPGSGPCGDGGPAAAAELSSPEGVAVDPAGVLYVADTGDQRIRAVSRSGTITTLAGTGTECTSAPQCGDGGAAASAQLSSPAAVAVDRSGRVLVADDGDNEVRAIAHGRIARLAGTGLPCAAAPACGDGGAATGAELTSPQGIAVDAAGDVLIADWGDNEVRAVSPRGTITRVAGTGTQCASAPACGDGRAATSATLSSPEGIATDGAGNVWVADTFDNEVRLVPAAPPGAASAAGAPLLAPLGTGTGTTGGSLAVRFALSAPASVTLTVTRGAASPFTVARGTAGAAGLGQLVWNGRLGGRAAPHGRYTLTLHAYGSGGTSGAALTASL